MVKCIDFLAKFADRGDVGFFGFAVDEHGEGVLWGLTFELSGRQRQDARPGPVKMYTVPPDRTGPGGLPLVLRLSEGLGVTARCPVECFQVQVDS